MYLLLENGSNVNVKILSRIEIYLRPILVAIDVENIQIMKNLISYGADVNYIQNFQDGATLLHELVESNTMQNIMILN